MSIDTVDEVTQVLTSAREAIAGSDWPLAYGMLTELHDSAAATDATWTEIRYLLGESCWALDDLESARRYYEEAAVGAGPHAAQATARVAELDRLGAADTASGDGVNADELTAVVNAAGEALVREDHDTAIGLYQRAYALPGADPAILSVIIEGLARCHVGLHRYDEAREWFAWLLQAGDAAFAEVATEGIAELDRLAAAKEMAADGTKVPELKPVFDAATEAYDNGDDDTALELYLSVLANPVLPPANRAPVLFNIAQVHIHRREYDEARARFAESAGLATGDMATWVAERLDMLERRDVALETAGLIPIE